MKHLKKSASKKALMTTLALAALLVSGCATTRSIPFTVQSDPLGAFVMYQVKSPHKANTTDWIYLGNTPLDIRREISNVNLKRADAFVLRIMKEGYFDQQKEWKGTSLVDESKDKGRIFWSPRLIKTDS